MKENTIKLITLALIVILGFAFYRGFISPKSRVIKSLRTSLKQIENQINSVFGQEVTLRGGVEQNESILRQLDKFKQQIPSEKDIPQIMDDLITKGAKTTHLDYKLIEPQEVKTEGKYKRFPVRLVFTSAYPDFLSYLYSLSELAVIIAIDKLDMKRSLTDPEKLDIELVLSAFTMPSQPGPETGLAKQKTPIALAGDPFAAEITLPDLSRPGTPYRPKAAPTGTNLKLQGIWQGKELRAFINGKMVKVGDTVDDYLVSAIADKKAVLTKNGKQYTLKLK